MSENMSQRAHVKGNGTIKYVIEGILNTSVL